MASMRMATHRVSRGESLWSIAERYYGRPEFWPLIRSANPGRVAKGGDLILVGTELGIPAAPTREERPQLQGSRGGGGPKGAEAIGGDIYPPRAVGSLTGPFGGRPVMGHPEGVPHQGRGQVMGGASGRTPAALCGMPKIKYDLRKLPEARFEIEAAGGFYLDIILSHKGSLTVSQLGSGSPFELKRGKYQFQADRVFRDLMLDVRLEVPFVGGDRFAIKLNGKSIWGAYSLSIKGVNRLAVKMSNQPIILEFKGWSFKGDVGFEADITLKYRGGVFEAVPVLTREAIWNILNEINRIDLRTVVVGSVILVGVLVVAEVATPVVLMAAGAAVCLLIPYEIAARVFDEMDGVDKLDGRLSI